MNEVAAFERILLSKDDFLKIENKIRLHEHLKRYATIKKFIYGRLLDFACGYGTYLLSNNPKISKIIGIDKDEESINWAIQEYETDHCKYIYEDVRNLTGKFNTLVSLETIKHFENDDICREIREKHQIEQIILSYPNKKSTHFNKFHLKDLSMQQVCTSFDNYILYHNFTHCDVTFLIFIRKPAGMPAHMVGNLIDQKVN